jgi:hypothetical protein
LLTVVLSHQLGGIEKDTVMIIVRVELHSAITGQVTELARMDICNVGGTTTRGDYECKAMRGRDHQSLSKRIAQREGRVFGHPRLSQHVWHLVAKALKALNYDN